jgi:hypothetical protein
MRDRGRLKVRSGVIRSLRPVEISERTAPGLVDRFNECEMIGSSKCSAKLDFGEIRISNMVIFDLASQH